MHTVAESGHHSTKFRCPFLNRNLEPSFARSGPLAACHRDRQSTALTNWLVRLVAFSKLCRRLFCSERGHRIGLHGPMVRRFCLLPVLENFLRQTHCESPCDRSLASISVCQPWCNSTNLVIRKKRKRAVRRCREKRKRSCWFGGLPGEALFRSQFAPTVARPILDRNRVS